MSEGSVELELKDGVATIVFEHPKSNSLPGSLLAKLAETVTACGKDDGVMVVVIRSAGSGAFCAGASFDELKSISNYEQGREFFMGFARMILALTRCPKITVARVQGKVVGGGVGMVAACDYAFAVPGAAAKLSEFAIGIGPFVVGPCVMRRIGPAKFSTMAVGAEWHSAEWMYNAGFYSELVPSFDELDLSVKKFAAKMAASSPEAAAAIKRMLWEDTADWPTLLPARAEISGQMVLGEFVRKALG
jgi:methylglutaconyl-CoA hydratase